MTVTTTTTAIAILEYFLSREIFIVIHIILNREINKSKNNYYNSYSVTTETTETTVTTGTHSNDIKKTWQGIIPSWKRTLCWFAYSVSPEECC